MKKFLKLILKTVGIITVLTGAIVGILCIAGYKEPFDLLDNDNNNDDWDEYVDPDLD